VEPLRHDLPGRPLARAGQARPTEAGCSLRRRPCGAGLTSNLPLEAIEADDALIAWEADGEPLTPEHGWPLRLVVPSRYFWKSAKWLRGLELLDHDQPGFWERYGYHNNADYRNEERYGF